MALRIGMDIGADTVKTVIVRGEDAIEELPILPVQGQPLRRAKEALEEALKVGADALADGEAAVLGVTGASAGAVAELVGADKIDEPNALAASIDTLYPDVRTVVEMGREGQKYLLFDRDDLSGRLVMEDSNLGNKCAAGSGSFLDHMAKRLNFSDIEEFAQVALEEENPASLSGRCSVFTESDIVHLYQKGTTRERIAAGIHQAICRNFRSAFTRGKQFRDKVAFIGGVSENPAVRKYLAKELELDGNLIVPQHNRTLGAIGAALRAARRVDLGQAIQTLDRHLDGPIEYVGATPLKLELSEMLPPPPEAEIPKKIAVAALGVDIGSVSTKAALVTEVDGRLHVLASYYRRTDGDPLAAVRDTIGRIHQQVTEKGYEIGEIFAATTGSGRYLTGDYIGADLIKNEITAQANGALAFIDRLDSIFEIGGQDSKFIRMDGDVIVDFEMNKACAAGCGAFLEKQAARLGIPIEEFGENALKGTNPPELDWTCTVFAESAMVHYQQNNVPIEDLCAAFCLASVKNYLHKNVASRETGKTIVFQGAVAFNRGMVAAYETLLGAKIIVPPYPHLTGAVGAARIAYRERAARCGGEVAVRWGGISNPAPAGHPVPSGRSSFRGFDQITEGKYKVKSFECRSCSTRCDVNMFQMDGGPRYFYNDRCEKFSGAHKKDLGAGLPDLFEERERMLFDIYSKEAPPGAKRAGVPRGLMFSEYFPLYKAFLTEIGFEVVPSDATNKEIVDRSLDIAIGEPCFPFKVAHGHYRNVLDKGIDILFAPGVVATEQPNPKFRKAQSCPYLQAAPEVITSAVSIPDGVEYLAPRLHFNRGRRHVERVFTEAARQLGKSRAEARRALEVGLDALRRFREWQERRGLEILDSLEEDQVAFIVVGRPYTLYDQGINMDIGKKVQDLGILAIPQDFIPLTDADVTDSWPNMYSRQIQKKLAAARLVRNDPRLRAVVLTYYACGPDSFANPFFKDEVEEPCYVMQIDEHTADAGVITRLEAFADTAVKGSTVGPGLPEKMDPRWGRISNPAPARGRDLQSRPDEMRQPAILSLSKDERAVGCGPTLRQAQGGKDGSAAIGESAIALDYAEPDQPAILNDTQPARLSQTQPAILSLSKDERAVGCGPTLRQAQGGKDSLGRPDVLGQDLKSCPSESHPRIDTSDKSIKRLAGRRLWIPHASEAARVLAAALQAYGIDAAPLPRSTDLGMNRARSVISEDVCLPSLMTMEDMLVRISEPDFDPSKEAFFQGNSEGPCRFGMYYMLQRRVLDKMGLEFVDIVTLGSKSEHGGLGTHFSMVVWDGFIAHDLLFKMLLRVRPYEINAGDTDALFDRYIRTICDMMPEHKRRTQDGWAKIRSLASTAHLEPFVGLLENAQREFEAIPQRRQPRPLVGVVGEFYVRIHDGANQGIVRKIEWAGGEAWLAPATEFFSYANRIGLMLSRERFLDTLDKKHLKEMAARWVNHKLAMRDEHVLYHATLPFLADYPDIGPEEVIEEGSKYVHYTFGGEAICSMGKSEDLARRGIDGIVSVIPFNCMPGNVVTALSQSLRKRHGNIPFLNLDYDGFIDSSRDAKITSFMWQVRERFRGRKAEGGG